MNVMYKRVTCLLNFCDKLLIKKKTYTELPYHNDKTVEGRMG